MSGSAINFWPNHNAWFSGLRPSGLGGQALMLPQLLVEAALSQQAAVLAPLHNATAVQNQDLIGSDDRAQPVGDHQHGVVTFKALDRLLD